MPHMQDANKQVNDIRQCLSMPRRPLALFLGGGCPTTILVGGEPLIPGIEGVTKFVLEKLKKCSDLEPLIDNVKAQLKKDKNCTPTVEDILTRVRALHAVAGNDEIRGMSASQLNQLDDKICSFIQKVANKDFPGANTLTPYHHIASWAKKRENPIEIFTTNYDLLMEQAFEKLRVPYFDGFIGVRKPFFDLRAIEEDKLPERWVRLWKLHGSVNWYQDKEEGVFRGAANENELKRIIHPSHLKYQESRRMPYLAMIDRLREFLKKPTAVFILCGYSFRDEHINEVILQGLEHTQTANAFALLYGNICDYQHAVKRAREQSNLNLLAQDGGVIGGRECQWEKKNSESEPDENGRWVRWMQVDGVKDEWESELTLGDFAVFGQLLQEVVGSVRPPLEDV